MKINGRVLDAKTDEPLENASVVVYEKGILTQTGTRTNIDGRFVLNSILLDDLYNKVNVSYVGYEPVTLSAMSANTDIYLTRKGETMDVVTVWAKIIKNRKNEILVFALTVVIASLLIIYISKMKQIKNL